MSRNVPELVSLARRYCEVIETSSTENVSWLKEVAQLLPRVHAAVGSINGGAHEGVSGLAADLDKRFELFTRLVKLLGDRDSYWLEFDSHDDSQMMTGSLADDLTDIYCELKHGLRTVDENPADSIHAWVEGFSRHWGQHLVDAQRHLSALASQGRLE